PRGRPPPLALFAPRAPGRPARGPAPPPVPREAGRGGGRRPFQVRIVPRRLPAEAGTALLVHHGRRRGGQAEHGHRRRVHPGIAREVGDRDALEVVVYDVLAGEVLLRLGEAHAREPVLVEGGVVAAAAEAV